MEASRLFHAIVVAGAAMGSGCRTDLPGADGEGGAPSTDATGSTSPSTSGSDASSTSTGNADCALADSPDDCLTPADYCSRRYCAYMTFEECRCESASPDSPADCDFSAQFHCNEWEPVYTGCWCDPSAPASPAECVAPCELSCHSFEPLLGCNCFCPITA